MAGPFIAVVVDVKKWKLVGADIMIRPVCPLVECSGCQESKLQVYGSSRHTSMSLLTCGCDGTVCVLQ